jgi:general nucleoside transport system ATP-binding protein
MITDCSVAENMVLKDFCKPRFSWRRLFLNRKKIENFANERIREYDIKVDDCKNAVSTLSGGNQQKVCVAREISNESDVLIVAQPTRGLDVASIKQVHECILKHRDRGGATLLISSELDEIIELSDRIAVIYEGEIMGIVPAEERINLERISLMMTGVTKQEEGSEYSANKS